MAPSVAVAQTAAPQTTMPSSTPSQAPATDGTAPQTDASQTSPGATAAPVVIPTTATTLVQPAAGVTVFDPSGTKVGTIKAITAQFITLTTAKGDVRLPVAGVGPGPNGAVVGGTAAEMEAAAAQALATATATPAKPARSARKVTRRR